MLTEKTHLLLLLKVFLLPRLLLLAPVSVLERQEHVGGRAVAAVVMHWARGGVGQHGQHLVGVAGLGGSRGLRRGGR